MWIKQLILAIFGLSSGLLISGAVFALIIKLRIIPRYAGVTRTADKIWWYEDCITLGGIVGNMITLFPLKLPIGQIGLGLYGIFSGIFLGGLVVALAETLNVIPIVSRRIRLKKGIGLVLLSLALGKTLGSLLFFYKGWTI